MWRGRSTPSPRPTSAVRVHRHDRQGDDRLKELKKADRDDAEQARREAALKRGSPTDERLTGSCKRRSYGAPRAPFRFERAASQGPRAMARALFNSGPDAGNMTLRTAP